MGKGWWFGLMLSLLALPVGAQTEEPGAIPVNLTRDTLVRNVGNVIQVKGTAGNLREDESSNNKVYRFTDTYNHSIFVRCPSGEAPISQTHYIITGTVTKVQDGTFELIEDPAKRIKGWDTTPSSSSSSSSSSSASSAEEEESEGLDQRQVLLLAGGGLIGLAVVLLLAVWRLQAGSRQREAALAEQSRIAQMEQQQRALEQQLAAALNPTERAATARMDSPPPKRSSTVMSLGKLTATAGPHQGETFIVANNMTVIGRDEGDIRLSRDETVSSRHAWILYSGTGTIQFADESRNGSRVNGQPVHLNQVEIQSGAILEVGLTTLEFTSFRAPDAAAPAAPAAEDGQRRAATVAVSAAAVAEAAAGSQDPGRAATAMFLGAELKVVQGPDTGLAFPLQKVVTTVGRIDGQDFKLQDPTVSRQHFTITHQDQQFVLSNLSSQGLRVNGEAVERHELASGDRIEAGSTAIEFRKMT